MEANQCTQLPLDGGILRQRPAPDCGGDEGGGAIWTSPDGGGKWTKTSAPVSNFDLRDFNYWTCLASSADGRQLVAGQYNFGRIYRSQDGGVTWTQTSAPQEYWSSITSSAEGAGIWTSVGPMTDLLLGQTYHYRAVAMNGGGTTLGSDLTFTTPLSARQVWRQQYFGTTNNSGDAADAADAADPDGDGQNNEFEFLVGLVPTDPASRFKLRVKNVPDLVGPKWIFFSPIVPGRSYVLKTNTTLNDFLWTALSAGIATDSGNERRVVDLSAGSPTNRRFYRVEITPSNP